MVFIKKIVLIHEKCKLSKIKGSICNIPIKAANICSILPRPTFSNGLIVVTLKRDLKHKGHVYFEPATLHTVYQALTYLKSYNFYEDTVK